VLQENRAVKKFSISTNKISENLRRFAIGRCLSMDIDTDPGLGIRDLSHRPTPFRPPLYSLHFNFLAQRDAHKRDIDNRAGYVVKSWSKVVSCNSYYPCGVV
jgi:hypothetical protein